MSLVYSLLYYVMISIALFAALGLLLWRNWTYLLPERHVLNLFLLGPMTGLVCARLFHVFYEEWPIYRENPQMILEFWLGGYVYYAGLIGGIAASLIYLKLQKQDPWPYLNLFIIPISLGSAIGRWGCFFAGCCYGKYCSLPWAIEGRHPTQIYSFLWEMMLFVSLIVIEKKGRKNLLVPFWLMGHGLGRFIIEQYRDDDRGAIHILSISSWISVGLVILGFYIFTRRYSQKIS